MPIQFDSASLARAAQVEWATARNIEIDPQGYTLRLEDNLVQPLNASTRAELSAGAGDELGSNGRRGKIQALHASSALAINVFDYWRDRPREPLARALRGMPESQRSSSRELSRLECRAPHPTWMSLSHWMTGD